MGVVAVAGILGGVFFFMRRRRNKELEEKHRRNAAISTFFPGKPPGSSGGYSVSDARLDPVMAQRRVSNGSIADNEDYSRKILRVSLDMSLIELMLGMGIADAKPRSPTHELAPPVTTTNDFRLYFTHPLLAYSALGILSLTIGGPIFKGESSGVSAHLELGQSAHVVVR